MQKVKENIHIALDTAGIGLGDYRELLKYIDLVLLDIKHITKEGFLDITCRDYLDKYKEFLKELNNSNVDVWIRQVIVPGVHDNKDYLKSLKEFIKSNINNVKRIDFLPYHKLGSEKYDKLNIINPYKDKEELDKDVCDRLYQEFMEDYNK